MQATKSDVPDPGAKIDAKYEVLSVLGKGGMGVVVAARHVDLQEVIALKFLLPEALEQPDAVERFLREARAVRKLSSQHVVKVLDIGRLSSTGLPYMAMELLQGEDLSAVIGRVGALPPAVACDFILQAADALGEAHANGIVHRDIKPANLFAMSEPVRGRTFIKVLDFGIAKLLDAAPATGTMTVMGSAFYMSPEQMRSSKKVDARADIWSLGVTLYELVTGRYPFEGDSLPELLMAISCDAPVPPRAHNPDLPVELEAVILKCLVKDPDARMPTIAALAAALAPFVSHDVVALPLQIHARPTPQLPPAAGTDEDLAPSTAQSASTKLETGATVAHFTSSNPGIVAAPPQRSFPVWVGAAGAGVGLPAAAAGWMSISGRPTPAAVAPAANQPTAPSAARASAESAQAPVVVTPARAAPDAGEAAPPSASTAAKPGGPASPAKLPAAAAPQRPAAPAVKPDGKRPSIGTSID